MSFQGPCKLLGLVLRQICMLSVTQQVELMVRLSCDCFFFSVFQLSVIGLLVFPSAVKRKKNWLLWSIFSQFEFFPLKNPHD